MASQVIQIHCPNQLVRGEKNEIEVVVNFDKPTKIRGIHAIFFGREETQATYTTTERDADGETRSVTKTARQTVEIVRQEFVLLGEQKMGFFSSLGDSLKTMVSGGSGEVIEPGERRFKVDVMVPNEAPASLRGENCKVVYEVMVSVDIPIKFDWNKAREATVSRPPFDFLETESVHVVFPDESGRSLWDKTFGKDVTMNLAIDRNVICPGEKALAMLTIETLTPFKVKRIACNLIGSEWTRADSHTDSHSHNVELGGIESPNVIVGLSTHEFEILVPPRRYPCTQTGTNFSIDWTIEVRLDVPWAKDPVIRAAIELQSGGKGRADS